MIRFRLGFGCFVIRQPIGLGQDRATTNENKTAQEKQFLHVTSFRQRSGLRKPPALPFGKEKPSAAKRRASTKRFYLMCPETSLVISNMLT